MTGLTDAALLEAVRHTFDRARSDPAAPFRIGVAVSGGGDSLALLHLLHLVAPDAGYDLHAVTVDHGLRPEAAAEAAQVADFCAGLGLPHDTLRWSGPQPTGNLMDQARRARLDLIAGWARARGIGHVALGHTADDRAESFLMNLARASGLDGLSGMRAVWAEAGVIWHRPLLGQTRAALRDYLRGQGIGWIDDPSNDNDRFTRVKARRALSALAPLGITVERLSGTIDNLAIVRATLTDVTAQFARGIREESGALVLPRDLWAGWPEEIRRRLLICAIRWMNGASYPPRAAQIAALAAALDLGRDATLAGVRFRARGDHVLITREARATMPPVVWGMTWDHRWQVQGPGGESLHIAALGAEGLRQCPDWRQKGPREALIVSPAVWQKDRLIAAPLARNEPEWGATLGPSFGMFILAH